jgi:hypothetical protein
MLLYLEEAPMSLTVGVRGLAASLIGAGALLATATGAHAQDQAPPTPAPAAQPGPSEPPPPPRNYPPPPPRGQNQYGYPNQTPYGYPNQNPYGYPNQYYGPPPIERRPSFRAFSFSAGLGAGVLAGPLEHDLALTYLFRFAFGVAENLSFVVGFDGAGTSSVSPETGEDSWLTHNILWGGLQFHVMPALYVRGGVGVGWGTESTDSIRFSSTGGLAVTAGVGWEFIQSAHTALALELGGNIARYGREDWGMAGLNLALSFY